jgi:hypothetical protein
MTGGDWLAAGILAGFVLLSLVGLLKWIFRAMAGAALGAVLLIALGQAGDVPGLAGTGDMLNRGRITPALHGRAKEAAVAIGVLDRDRPVAPVRAGEAGGSFPSDPQFDPADSMGQKVEYQWRRDGGDWRRDSIGR